MHPLYGGFPLRELLKNTYMSLQINKTLPLSPCALERWVLQVLKRSSVIPPASLKDALWGSLELCPRAAGGIHGGSHSAQTLP